MTLKKNLFFILAWILGAVLLVGCRQVPTLTCRIIDGAEEGIILLTDMEGHEVYRIGAEDVPIKGADALVDGMVIKIEYSGTMMYTSPSIPADVTRIIVTDEPVNDTAGLCLQVFEDLWKDHPGLHAEVEYLGVDLSAMEGLTDNERWATVWRLKEKSGLELVDGTFDELVEQGDIGKEPLCWEDGVFFSMEGSAEKFDAQKWRAGDAACYLVDCTYTEKDGVWSYSSGSFAVS